MNQSGVLLGPAGTKMDKPTNAGTLDQVLRNDGNGGSYWGGNVTNNEIQTAVGDWLDTNVPTGSTVVVDRSLTTDGAAADAKQTGELILVSDNEPSSSNNRLWVDSDNAGEYSMPLLTDIDNLVAIHEAPVSTAPHAVGELIGCNGVLYRATDAIAIGDTLDTETNVEAVTISGLLAEKAADISELSDSLDAVNETIADIQEDISDIAGMFINDTAGSFLNDSSNSRSQVWSADRTSEEIGAVRNTVYKLHPTITATGTDELVIHDGLEGSVLKSLKVTFDPVQTGSGDPSPENVRPITGQTSIDVDRVDPIEDPSDGSTTTFTYHKTVTFEGPFYGGYVQVIDGYAQTTWNSVTFDGVENTVRLYRNLGTPVSVFAGLLPRSLNRSNQSTPLCNMLTAVSEETAINGQATYCFHVKNDYSKTVYFCFDSEIDTAEQANAWLAEHPVQVVYPAFAGSHHFVPPKLTVINGSTYQTSLGTIEAEYLPDNTVEQTALEALTNLPSSDGTYYFKMVMDDGIPTFSWEAVT